LEWKDAWILKGTVLVTQTKGNEANIIEGSCDS